MESEFDGDVKLHSQVRHIDGLLNPHQLIAGLLVRCLDLIAVEVAVDEVRLLAAILPGSGDLRDRCEPPESWFRR